MNSLEIRLFGPFDVRLDGEPLRPLRSRKGQWILALLALRHDREVARDWLAGTLWPDSDESQALGSLRAGQDELRAEDRELRGVLQVATPSDLGRNVLLPWLAAFRRQHPKLVLRLFMSDRVSDVFKEPVDVAVRYGPPPDASFVALPLAAENRRVLVASPGYVQRCGQPASLQKRLPPPNCRRGSRIWRRSRALCCSTCRPAI